MAKMQDHISPFATLQTFCCILFFLWKTYQPNFLKTFPIIYLSAEYTVKISSYKLEILSLWRKWEWKFWNTATEICDNAFGHQYFTFRTENQAAFWLEILREHSSWWKKDSQKLKGVIFCFRLVRIIKLERKFSDVKSKWADFGLIPPFKRILPARKTLSRLIFSV